MAKNLQVKKKVVDLSQPVDAGIAKDLILKGEAPANLRVIGHLDLSKNSSLTTLPAGLIVDSLDLSECESLLALPFDLKTRRLDISHCRSLSWLPRGLSLYQLKMQYLSLRILPVDLKVENRLDLEECRELEFLPDNFKVGSLILRNCTSLRSLPEGLDLYYLDITGCTGLTDWPKTGSVRFGRLNIGGCTNLHTLPDWLSEVTQLNLADCENISTLPEHLKVSSWLDLAGTKVKQLPDSLKGVQLRWRGVPIDERIAFQPETINSKEILATRNVELRRVLLDRMGYEAFLQDAKAIIVDRDRDAGGERRLVRVQLENDEDLVCVSVICPSTGRQYIIRVPPIMETCRAAVAWIAGFDSPDQYNPIAET